MHIDNVKFLILSKFAYTKFSEKPCKLWLCRRSATQVVSPIGRGMASTLVWNGALALFRGVRTNAGISRTGLSRSLRAAYKALSGLRKEDNGRTAALRQKQDTLSSSIVKVTVLQTMWKTDFI